MIQLTIIKNHLIWAARQSIQKMRPTSSSSSGMTPDCAFISRLSSSSGLTRGSMFTALSVKLRRTGRGSIPLLQPGFTFIEVMIAITLLATFGTSLFMVQSNILSKIFNTHRQIMYSNDTQQEELNFSLKVQQAVLQKKSPDTITIETKKKNPERTITIKMKPFSEQSSLHKTFGKQIRFTQTTITHDQYKDTWYSFIYIPELKEKTTDAKTDTTTPKVTP